MKQTIVISEILKTSWQSLKSQLWILVGLLIGYMIISFTLSAFAGPTSPTSFSIGRIIVVYLLSMIIGLIFSLGYLKNLFQTLDGIEPQFSAYGQQARKILTYFVASILVSIVVSIGFMLLIIPGVYLALRLQFFAAFIVEEDAGIIDSIQRSWKITEGQVLPLFVLLLTMIGLIILGAILLLVGVFVTAPLVYMMYCTSFRKLNTSLLIIEEA